MDTRKHSLSLLFVIIALMMASFGLSDEDPSLHGPVNKLMYMYDVYYLPFSVEFREGRTVNDILPYIKNSSGESRIIKAEELQNLDSQWATIKEPWKDHSLLQSTQVAANSTVRISSHLVSHRIGITRSAFDNVSISERIQLAELLKEKPPEVQAAFKQLTFLRSLLGPSDNGRFNFFVFSASWCDSCKEYRVLLENYLRNFSQSDVVLHSVVIDDPKEEIFERPLLKELFPNPKKYSHESIPRFAVLEFIEGKPHVLEEGEALQALYERYLKPHRGYMDNRATLFKSPITRALSSTSR